jgi:hypothetical protein
MSRLARLNTEATEAHERLTAAAATYGPHPAAAAVEAVLPFHACHLPVDAYHGGPGDLHTPRAGQPTDQPR